MNFTPKIKNLSFSIFMSLVFSVSAFAGMDEHLESATTRIKDAIAGAKIGGDVKLLDLEAGDFARLGVEAAVEAYQNDDKVTYSRSEKLVFSKALHFQTPGPAFLKAGISKGSEVEFIRQFDSQKEALNIVKYRPYAPARIPMTATKALDLKEGDYARFQSRMALTVGAGVGHSLGIGAVSGAKNYIIYGDFQIEVFRKSDQRVGLRVSSMQKNSKTFGVHVGQTYSLDAFAVVGLGAATRNKVTEKLNEKIVDQILPANLLGVSSTDATGSLISIEYEYNLKDILTIEAFEKIVNPLNWEFRKHVEIDGRKLFHQRHLLTVNTRPSEELVGSTLLGESQVRKVFQGESQFHEKSRGIEIKLPLIQRNGGSHYVEQDFKFQNESGEVSYLKLAQLTITNSINALMKLIGRHQEREANILFETNAANQVTGFHELNFSYSREETLHLSNERRRIQGQVHRMLPEKYHKDFQLGKIAGTLLDRDVNVYMHSSFHKKAFEYVSQLSVRELDAVIDAYFSILVKDQAKVPFSNIYGLFKVNQGPKNKGSWRERAKKEMVGFKSKLQLALLNSSGLKPNERWEVLKQLSHDHLFRQMGSGIFIRLAEYASRKFHQDFGNLISFELRMHSADGQKFSKTIGSVEKSEVMRKVLIARDRILGRKLKKIYWD